MQFLLNVMTFELNEPANLREKLSFRMPNVGALKKLKWFKFTSQFYIYVNIFVSYSL